MCREKSDGEESAIQTVSSVSRTWWHVMQNCYSRRRMAYRRCIDSKTVSVCFVARTSSCPFMVGLDLVKILSVRHDKFPSWLKGWQS